MNKWKAGLLSTGVMASVLYVAAGATFASAQTKAPKESVNGNITEQQRLKADQDQDNWLLYGRTYENQRFSPVKEITADNVKNLQPVALLQTGVVGSFENSPLVYRRYHVRFDPVRSCTRV